MLEYRFNPKTGLVEGFSPGGKLLKSAQYAVGSSAIGMVSFSDPLFAGVIFEPTGSGVTVKVVASK